MKAYLNYEGVLCIEPENGTEAYALKKWYRDFSHDSDSRFSALNIYVDLYMKPNHENKDI